MALPFLKQKQVAGLIMQTRKTDGSKEEAPEDQSDQGLSACGDDLIRAINAKDGAGVAAALRAAFEILESEPHQEAGEDEGQEAPEQGSGV